MATSTKTRKVNKTNGNGHFNDGAETLARASEGTVSTLQVRMLRSLKASKSAMTRKDLKAATKHWPNRDGYHIGWVKALRGLSPKFVKVSEIPNEDGTRTLFHYTLTAAGRDLLVKLDKVATNGHK